MRKRIRILCTLWSSALVGIGMKPAFVCAQPKNHQHAYLVVDLDSGKILRKKDINKECYPASLTKMMTLYLLFDALRSRKVTLQTPFKVSLNAERQIPSHLGVRAGEHLSVKTIIEALIVKSANDVAVVAAEGVAGSVTEFVTAMNARARKLRMATTHFKNPSGVPDPGQKTSAKDIALLARAILRDFPEYAHFFRMRSFCHKGRTHYTHNHILNALQGANGMKTGFINASGYNIVTSVLRYDVQRRPHRFVCVVLGGKTRLDRDQEAIRLLEEVMLERGAVYYDANAVRLLHKPGPSEVSTEEKPEGPKFVRAMVRTKGGLDLLLKSYQEERERGKHRQIPQERRHGTVEPHSCVENIDLLLRNIQVSRPPTKASPFNRKRT